MIKQTQLVMVLAALAAACGGGETALPDAANTVDATPTVDAAPDAIPSGTAQVIVAPSPGVSVVVHDQAGVQQSVVAADASGTTTVNVVQGGTVSVTAQAVAAGGGGPFGYAYTVLGVEPGDVLRFQSQPSEADTFVTVTYPAIANHAVTLVTSCGFSSGLGASPAQTSLPADCIAAGFDAAVVATSNADGSQRVATATGLTGTDVTIGGSFANYAPRDVTVRTVGAGTQVVELDLATRFPNIEIDAPTNTPVMASQANGDLTGMPSLAPIAGSSTIYEIAVVKQGAGAMLYVAREANGTAALTVDASAAHAPFVPQAPLFDTASRSLRWVEIGEGELNLAYALVSVGSPAGYFQWAMVGQPSGGELTVPQFSGAAQAFAVEPSDLSNITFYGMANVPQAYADIRGEIFIGDNVLELEDGQALALVPPANNGVVAPTRAATDLSPLRYRSLR